MSTQDQELRSVGLKATLPRIKVLEIIRGSEERHLSAEDVFRRLLEQGHDVGLATVYRVLSQLEAAGLLSRNVFDGGKAVFEMNEGDHLRELRPGGRVHQPRHREGAVRSGRGTWLRSVRASAGAVWRLPGVPEECKRAAWSELNR